MAHGLGISVRRLEGWEPRTVTEYEYDQAGRLVRSVTTREPEWDDEQRAVMLALHQCRALTCTGCGGWLPDTTAHERYVVEPPTRCHRCTAISGAQERHSQDHKHMHATRWTATPVRG